MVIIRQIKKNACIMIKLTNSLLREESQGPLSSPAPIPIPLGWNVLLIHSYEMFRTGKSIQAESR